MSGASLLCERAAIHRYNVPDRISAGGGTKFWKAADGWVALNLSRNDDRELLPALFMESDLDPWNDDAIAVCIADSLSGELVSRGREMGLAIARHNETLRSPALQTTATGDAKKVAGAPPVVVDLSNLWAGPLAGHLLWLGGCRVIKVENPRRPDNMRSGDPELFALLNQGKDNIALDPTDDEGRSALIELVAGADIVIESARPRALLQLGVDADRIVRESGVTWLSITAHGITGNAASWVGFGDDCAVSGGLSAALLECTGQIGFVGDAVADPLAGIAAARAVWQAWSNQRSARMVLSMSSVVAKAIREEKQERRDTFAASLRNWHDRIGQPITRSPVRRPVAPVYSIGTHDMRCFEQIVQC